MLVVVCVCVCVSVCFCVFLCVSVCVLADAQFLSCLLLGRGITPELIHVAIVVLNALVCKEGLFNALGLLGMHQSGFSPDMSTLHEASEFPALDIPKLHTLQAKAKKENVAPEFSFRELEVSPSRLLEARAV